MPRLPAAAYAAAASAAASDPAHGDAPQSSLHVTVGVNYTTPELDQFVRGSAATTPGSTARFLSTRTQAGGAGPDGAAVDGTAFVPARPTDLGLTGGERGGVLTAAEAKGAGGAAESAKGSANNEGEQSARCVSSDEAISAGADAKNRPQSGTVMSSSAKDTNDAEAPSANAAAPDSNTDAAAAAAAASDPAAMGASTSSAAPTSAAATTAQLPARLP